MTRVRSESGNMDEAVQQEIERYRQRKQVFAEMLALRQEESYRVQSIPAEESARKGRQHSITRYMVHCVYRRGLRLIRGSKLEMRLKRTRLYEALANRGVIMRLSTGDSREGRA